MRLSSWVSAVVLTSAGLVVAPAPAYAEARCLGQRATLVGTAGDDTLMGTAGRDVIVALSGSDQIDGLGGDDLICAGPGPDRLYGGSGNDRLYGENGGDTFHDGPGNDRVYAGLPANPATYSGPLGETVVITYGRAFARPDLGTLDVVHGQPGNDTVYGSAVGLDFSESPRGVRVNLEKNRVRGVGRDSVKAVVAVVVGSRFADHLRGDTTMDMIYGGRGKDVLRGGRADDSLTGGPGHDLVYGGSGWDSVYGVDDEVRLGEGPDFAVVRGGAVFGGAGGDVVVPERPAYLDGGSGSDMLDLDFIAEYSDITASLASGTAVVGGIFLAFTGFEELRGGLGNDTLTGDDQSNYLHGGPGNDVILGLGGDDDLRGFLGTDTLDGGDGNDKCDGETVTACE